jgi:hypothetical protein
MVGADTIVFGRRTYEMFESFWPNGIKDLQRPYRLSLVRSRSFPTGTVLLRYSADRS